MFHLLRRYLERQARAASRPRPVRQARRALLALEPLEDRRLLSGGAFATAPDSGAAPLVKVYDASSGQETRSFLAYDAGFTGGVRVAMGDVNGDGTADVITAPGPGGGPDLRVYDGQTGSLLQQFLAYDENFTGGAYVASGDVNADGYDDIIVGADAGGGPNVKVFSGQDDSVLYNFFAYDPNFTGGVRVAAADVNGDGYDDVIAGAGPGGGPNVSVYSGADGSVLASYFAYDRRFSAGIGVAGGDLNGDGFGDVIVGAGRGGGPNVVAFSGRDNSVLDNFFAYDPNFTGGVRVGAASSNGNTQIITTPGPGGGSDVRTVDGATGATVHQLLAYDANFFGGLFAAGDCDRSTPTDSSAVATHFEVVPASNVQAGVSTPVLVVALDDSNHIVPNYTGTVSLASSDAGATLPADYTFQASDRGRHLFQVTFAAADSETIAATDTADDTLTGSATVQVNAAPVAARLVLAVQRNVPAGEPVSVTVYAVDANGRIVPNYVGTVKLTSSDADATLPDDYTFTAADRGRHTFQVTLATPGSETLTVTDTADDTITGAATFRVRSLST